MINHSDSNKEIRQRLRDIKVQGLRKIAHRLGNSGYANLRSAELVEFILDNNSLETIKSELGMERKRRFKLTAAFVTVPVALMTLWFILIPRITEKTEQEKFDSYIRSLPADTFKITPSPEEHLKIDGSSVREEPDYSCIEILEDHRAYDFRRSFWIDSSKSDPFLSPVILRRRMKIAKDERCNELTMRFSTSGSTLSAQCSNRAFKFWTPTKLIPNHFEKKLMKSIDIIVDLSYDKPVDTIDLVFEVTYFGGFQNPEKEWIGGSVLGTSIAKKSTLRAFFTEERHPTEIEVCGHIGYDTKCYEINEVRILPSIGSYDHGWLLFSNDSMNFLNGIDTKWKWENPNLD